MQLDAAQVAEYKTKGYVTVPSLLSPDEISLLRSGLGDVYSQTNAPMVRDSDGGVRLCFAPHLVSSAWSKLPRHPSLLAPTRQLLGGDVYVHQTKVTAKTPLAGDGWPWHQDFHFWKKRDRIEKPQLLSTVIFLDEVTALNGPIYIVPGTQSEDLTEGEEYHLSRATMAKLCLGRVIDVPIGPAGTVIFLDAMVVHGSPSNITPYERTLGFITYNRVGNQPALTRQSPTEVVVGRDFGPLELLATGLA